MNKDMLCANHPTSQACFVCDSCARMLCAQCVCKSKNRMQANSYDYMCPKCNIEMTPLGVSHMIEPFWQRLPLIFRYPFQETPLFLIIFNTLIWFTGELLLNLELKFLHFFVYLSRIMTPIIVLYYCNGVFLSTCYGHFNKAPEWPELKSDTGLVLKQSVYLFFILGFIGPYQLQIKNDIVQFTSLYLQFFLPTIIITLTSIDRVPNIINPFSLIRKIGWPYLILAAFVFLFVNGVLGLYFDARYYCPDIIALPLVVAGCQYYMIAMYHLLGYVTVQFHKNIGYNVDPSIAIQVSQKYKQIINMEENPLLAEVNMMVTEGKFDEALHLIITTTKGEFDDTELGLRCLSLLKQCEKQDKIPFIGKSLLELLAEEDRQDEGMALYKKCFEKERSFSLDSDTLYWLFDSFCQAENSEWAIRTSVQFIKTMPDDYRVAECQYRYADLVKKMVQTAAKQKTI